MVTTKNRYVVREKIRIYYEAKRLATGLTDVTIDVTKPDGTKSVDGASMTEFGSGIYYYDWTPTSPNTYLVTCDSASVPRTHFESLIIFSRTSRYGQEIRGGGGMVSRTVYSDIWSTDEKNAVLRFMSSLAKWTKAQEAFNISISDTIRSIPGLVKQADDNVANILEKMETLPSDQTEFDLIKDDITALKELTEKIHSNFKDDEILDAIENSQTKELAEVKESLTDIGKILIKTMPNDKLEEIAHGA